MFGFQFISSGRYSDLWRHRMVILKISRFETVIVKPVYETENRLKQKTNEPVYTTERPWMIYGMNVRPLFDFVTSSQVLPEYRNGSLKF